MATITKQNIIAYAQWRYGKYPLPEKLDTMTVEEILKEYEWSKEEVQKFINDYIPSRWAITRADYNNMNNFIIMQELKAMFKLDEADHNLENYEDKLENYEHKLENYVNYIIKISNLDENALQLDVTDRIDFIFGLPIRHNRKTFSCNRVIEKDVWEFLRDIDSDLKMRLDAVWSERLLVLT